jgi:uncharacterized membrane protein YqgA involved in biofilm formation
MYGGVTSDEYDAGLVGLGNSSRTLLEYILQHRVGADMTLFRSVDGTLLNAATVLIGGLLGTLAGSRLQERFIAILFIALGLFTAVTGLQEALGARNSLVVLAGLLIGGLIGEVLEIERQLDRFGNWVQARLRKGRAEQESHVSEGFVTASLLFCVGPLTVLGSLTNGLNGDITDLAIKSMLDGFAALALAATLGWGVLLSIGTILVVQGGLSLGAGAIAPALHSNTAIIPELVATGGFLLIGIGLRLLKIANLKPGNFLPALVVTPVLVVLVAAWHFGIKP